MYDSPDSENLDGNSDENNFGDINIELEKYYAVNYDLNWYIGRTLKYEDEKWHVKFFKSNLDSFEWPRNIDVQHIESKYIFYGPIQLIGCGPFTIKRIDRININNKYKIETIPK